MNQTHHPQPSDGSANGAPSTSPCLTYEEARQMHLDDFAKWTPDEKIEWLGDMLELMELGEEARKPTSPP